MKYIGALEPLRNCLEMSDNPELGLHLGKLLVKSQVSICSMPPLCLGAKSPLCGKATVSTSPDIHFDSSCNTPDIQAAEALDQFPSDEKASESCTATLDVKSSGSSSHSPSKMSAKGLRNSFRKLVKPLVKKRNPEVEEGEAGEGGSEESLLSRVGSSRWRFVKF